MGFGFRGLGGPEGFLGGTRGGYGSFRRDLLLVRGVLARNIHDQWIIRASLIRSSDKGARDQDHLPFWFRIWDRNLPKCPQGLVA
jgi:hypothetical protein